MVERDVVFSKIGIIQRCLQRIQHVTKNDPGTLDSFDVQDIFTLNLQRAVQAAIDLASHIVASEGLGVPQDLKENFVFLEKAGVLSSASGKTMLKMVGFRNVAVHEYENLDVQILKSILANNLKDLEDFYVAVVEYFQLNKK